MTKVVIILIGTLVVLYLISGMALAAIMVGASAPAEITLKQKLQAIFLMPALLLWTSVKTLFQK
jgi:hypothetical protein